jgi:hypothetical protein
MGRYTASDPISNTRVGPLISPVKYTFDAGSNAFSSWNAGFLGYFKYVIKS